MEPPKLNKEQLIRLPDSRKHSLVFDWLTKVTDFLRLSDTKQIREKQVNYHNNVYIKKVINCFNDILLGWFNTRIRSLIIV